MTSLNMEIDLTSVDEVLATTRSVRRKLDFERPVEREVLEECIEIALQAPTGAFGDNWRFVVVTESAPKKALADLYTEVLMRFAQERAVELKSSHRALVDRLHQIPAMIFVCVAAPPPEEGVGPQTAYYGSILPAAWSLMLALRAREIGSTWTSLLSGEQERVRSILGMPEDAYNLVMLPIGYNKGAKLRRAERGSASAVTSYEMWSR